MEKIIIKIFLIIYCDEIINYMMYDDKNFKNKIIEKPKN